MCKDSTFTDELYFFNKLPMNVSFNTGYGFHNINKLKQTGVLLYFQEHDDIYIIVKAGKEHNGYKIGDKGTDGF